MNFLKFLRISTVFFAICNLQFAIYLYADVPTAQFLLVGQGARAEAMGQSVVSNCFDYTATYWNPGAVAFLSRTEVGFNHSELIAEIYSNYLSFVLPYKKFGFGLLVISEQTAVPAFAPDTSRLPDVEEKNVNLNFVVAYRVSDLLSLGIGFGPVSMQLANFKAETLNVNLGAIYKKDKISAGLAFANLGGPMFFVQPGPPEGQEEAQPALLRAGVSYSFSKDFLVSGSLENVFSDKMAGGIRLGAEYFIAKNLALRGGFKGGSGGPVPCLGFGLRFSQFVLDYSLSLIVAIPWPKLKGTETQRVSLSIKFGKEEVVEIKKPEVPVEKPKPVRKPEERMNIAVADLDAHNVSAMEAATIADFIRAELINSGVFVVLERSSMAKVLAEQRFQQTGCTTTECAVQMGKILNVEKMLVGSFSKMVNIFYISARLVDVETGTALLAETVSCPAEGDLYAKVKELVDKIVRRVTE